MMGWISAGTGAHDGLPPDALTEEELRELHRLLAAREGMLEQLAALEQRVELLVVSARDRRGLIGRIRVRPEDGRIEREEG